MRRDRKSKESLVFLWEDDENLHFPLLEKTMQSPLAATSSVLFVTAPTTTLDARQWHLNGVSTGQSKIDLDVTKAWGSVSGKGVKVGVFDDGIDVRNLELSGRYVASREMTGNIATAIEAGDGHGTAVAGIIAAARNGIGMTGIAYDAEMTGIDIFKSGVNISSAMAHLSRFDVTNHSWGFTAVAADNPLNASWRSLFFTPIEASADNGRGGLGTINVVAAGNDRHLNDNAGLSGLTTMRETITVGAVTDQGRVAFYSNPGASLLVVAPSNGGQKGIATTDMMGTDGYASGDVTTSFGGTSAAAPMVTGVVALMLEANPLLGWRDVQEILGYSARHVGSAMGAAPVGGETDRWAFNGARDWNGGGLHFSADYGFGLVNAHDAVRLAENWRDRSTSANESVANASLSGYWQIEDAKTVTLTFTIARNIDVEHVQVDFGNLFSSSTSQYDVELVSARGTSSILLDNDGNGGTFTGSWRFLSQEMRGEESAGTWTLRITDTVAGGWGYFTDVRLNVFGTVETVNDDYIYTDEFSRFYTVQRSILHDIDGGIDVLNASAVTTNSVLNLASGSSMISGRGLLVTANTIENAIGGDGNDTITGNALANDLRGGRGNDVLTGGAGDDRLLDGQGLDRLTGGAGRDRFELSRDTDRDVVTDFRAGEDWLVFDDALWGGVLANGRLDAGELTNVNTLTGLNVTGFVFNSTDRTLYFDALGEDPFTPVALAQLDGVSTLRVSDFLIV
jgi:subtilisin-like proprotein convertase family protein